MTAILLGVVFVIFIIFVGFGGIKGGLYSNSIISNVAYADANRKIPISVSFEYEGKNEEELNYPVQINEDNPLTLQYNMQTEKVGDVLLIITNSNNKERFTMELMPGQHEKELSLPQGEYDFKIVLKKGSSSGEIRWQGIENE